MVCDLMLAISKGAVRPTKIMQRANLTWNALLLYLNALALNGLVRREERGSTASYHLTEHGKDALRAYLALKEELGPLKLETIDTKSLVEILKFPSGERPERPELDQLVGNLRAAGYKILENVVKGTSGIEHEFAVVARDPGGVTHGYVYAETPDEHLILTLFIKHIDTGNKVHVVFRKDPARSVIKRAREYGIELNRLTERP